MEVTETQSGRRRTDAELIRGVRAGSTKALGDLYRRYARTVYRLAYRVTGTAEDAADVTQDVFLGLRYALGRYEEMGRFAGWLKRVAARAAIAHVRRRRDHVELLPDLTAAKPGPHPWERIAIERALAALPDTQRVVFLLKEVEGFKHREIAELLGISVAASQVRLHRAWRRLRRSGE